MTLSAMGDIVLDPSVFSSSRTDASNSSPLLEQYKNDPGRVRDRATLTMTWMNASLIARGLTKDQIPTHSMISSATLAHVSLRDGWNSPYCVFANDNKVVLMSSGGRGSMDCVALTQIAKGLADTESNARLKRLPTGILVTVQPVTGANSSKTETR
jgi:hypothetical protein